VTDHNWTWRLPWPVSDMLDNPDAKARAAALREWSAQTNRGTAGSPQPSPA
jgi:4-alpha-glucanotransferase